MYDDDSAKNFANYLLTREDLPVRLENNHPFSNRVLYHIELMLHKRIDITPQSIYFANMCGIFDTSFLKDQLTIDLINKKVSVEQLCFYHDAGVINTNVYIHECCESKEYFKFFFEHDAKNRQWVIGYLKELVADTKESALLEIYYENLKLICESPI